MRRRGAGGRALLLLLLWALAAPAFGDSRVLPRLSFRVLRTPHFRVYYHPGEERLAYALASIAESVRSTLPDRLGLPAPALTHVLLVNQDDEANGSATPVPYDTVTINAVWPAASEIVGNTNDWLRLVFTHEYAHVVQLHQSHGWARAARAVFGRAPFAFPNLFLPEWEVEGLATFEETRATGQGRLAAGDSLAVVRERTGEIGRERLDQVSGGQVAWPGGLGSYLYGGFFTDYLARRFGEQKLGELALRSSRRVPYFASPAFKAVFGDSLGNLWSDYQRGLREADRSRRARFSGVIRLTHHGYYVSSPQFTADASHLVYATRNADELPAVVERGAPSIGAAGDREARQAPRRIATRFGGEQVSVRGRVAFYDQEDYEVNVALRADLYAADLVTGRVQRLSRGARLLAPDVSPDLRTLACVRVAADGHRQLALFKVTGDHVGGFALSELPAPADEVTASYGAPRWSPDGALLAVERRLEGGPSEIAILNPVTGTWRVAATSPRGRNLTPSWWPDGGSLVFASDRDGGPFAIYHVDLQTDTTRRLLDVPGGALSPLVAPDASRLVYVGYTAAGYDLFEAPLPAVGHFDGSTDAQGSDVEPQVPAAARPGAAVVPVAADEGPYRPWGTVLPRAWYPAADTANGNVRLGLSTIGTDLLARHVFGVAALWRVRGGEDAMNGPERARPDWNAFYVYDRFRPSFYAAASEETEFLRQYARGVRAADAQLRERNFAVGMTLPFLRFDRQQTWLAEFNLQHDTLDWLGGRRLYSRNAVRTGWAFSNAHLFGLSVSPEQGVSIGLTSEQVRSALGADGRADGFTGEARGYWRVGGRHSVLAARVAGGVGTGDLSVARAFYLGGPGPAGPLLGFGSSALDLLRGFETHEFVGRRLVAANLEYRFPLWRVERGRGTWPLFLRTLHAAVFVDSGQAWTGSLRWADTKASFGAELSLDTIVGFALPMTVAAGVARPRDEGGFRGTTAYLRLGRAF